MVAILNSNQLMVDGKTFPSVSGGLFKHISKAPFELEVKGVSGIPEAVLRRCTGKQRPVVPHKQRLLVASIKEAKADSKGKRDPNAQKESKPPPKKRVRPRRGKTRRPMLRRSAARPHMLLQRISSSKSHLSQDQKLH